MSMTGWMCAASVALLAWAAQLSAQEAGVAATSEMEKNTMQKQHVRVTCSWDDGNKNDVRLTQILRQHRAKGTFFIYPENYVFYTKDPEAALKKDPFLITPLAAFIATYRGFEVGAHGFQHPDMRKLKPEELWFQLTESKRVLEEWFKQPVKGMAYPNGAYNPEVEAAVKKAGYVYARTVENSPQVFPAADPYALRVSLHHQSPKFWEEFERVKAVGGVFYFWGHSYELKTDDDWKGFEEKIARLSADPAVEWVTHLELFEAAPPAR